MSYYYSKLFKSLGTVYGNTDPQESESQCTGKGKGRVLGKCTEGRSLGNGVKAATGTNKSERPHEATRP